MVWSIQSPNLNSTERLFGELEKRLRLSQEGPKDVGELWTRIENQLAEISASTCQNLMESMLKRIEAVVLATGDRT